MKIKIAFALELALLAVHFVTCPQALANSSNLVFVACAGTNGITAIGPNVAINREGVIAFTGNDSAGSRPFWVSYPFIITPMGITGSTRTYSGVGISGGGNPKVLARELVSGPSYVVREWDVNGGAGTILGSSVSAPVDFNSASGTLDMNNFGVAAVSVLTNGSTVTALMVGSSRPMTTITNYAGAIGLRPQIADTSEVVLRDGAGEIVVLNGLSGPNIIASSANGFAIDTGNRPGISSDGSAIAFSGNRGLGASLFVVIPSIGPTPFPIAGGEYQDGFTGFDSEQRVGVSAIHNSSGDKFTLVFQAMFNGTNGIYTRQLSITNGVVDSLGAAQQVVQVGDSLQGSTVNSFTLYRPINTQGTIVFSVQLADGRTGVVRLPTVQFGVDVHAGKGYVDWMKVSRAGKTFAFIKATEGATFTDTNFVSNVILARNAGLLVGAYHFARPLKNPGTSGAISEATNFLKVAGLCIKPGFLPPVLDIEDDPNSSGMWTTCLTLDDKVDLTCQLEKPALSEWVRTWVQTVTSQTGVAPLVYTTRRYATNGMESDLSSNRLWIATYLGKPDADPGSLEPWSDWSFQQYSKSGQVDGITGNVDLDSFKGSLADLGQMVIGGQPPILFTGMSGGPLQAPLNGKFQFRIASPVVQECTVQGSTDLSSWTDIQTLIMNNSEATFTDPNAGAHQRGYYRPKP